MEASEKFDYYRELPTIEIGKMLGKLQMNGQYQKLIYFQKGSIVNGL